MTLTKAITPSLTLPKSIYGIEIDPKKTPFGLLNGQIHSDGLLNNAGWFNLAGEKIGHGDISIADLSRIASNINGSECFMCITEFDTVWTLPKELNANEPGLDFVLKHCIWAAWARHIVKVGNSLVGDKTVPGKVNDIPYTKISRARFDRVIRDTFLKKAPAPGVKDTLKMDDMDLIIKNNLKSMNKLINSGTSPTFVAHQTPTITQQPVLPGFPAVPTHPATAAPKPAVAKAPVKVKRLGSP